MPTRLRARILWIVPVALVAAAAHPTLARSAGVDFWNLSDARADLCHEDEHSRELADRDDQILRRIEVKEALVADLIAGRADLARVAARFLALTVDDPIHLDALRTTVPGDSDLERAALTVIGYAAAREPDPAARAALEARLTAELARMQDADHPAVR